jgi:HEPN domain-containing protein
MIFPAQKVIHALNCFNIAVRRLGKLHNENPHQLPPEISREWILGRLNLVGKTCTELELEAAAKHLEEFKDYFGNEQYANCGEALVPLKHFCDTLQSEIKQKTFVLIPKGKKSFFQRDALFGQRVADAFPEATEEIKSAGNCLALELNTAAVFHLMRAAEVALKKLARHLKIKYAKGKPIDEAMWGEIIGAIKDKILELQKKPARHRRKLENYQKVLLTAAAIKELWRNPVSHSGKMFSDNDANGVLGHTGEFMENARIAIFGT